MPTSKMVQTNIAQKISQMISNSMLLNRLPDLLRHQLRHDAALLPLEDQVLPEEGDEAAHEVPLQRLLDGAVEDEVGGRVHEADGVGDLLPGEDLVEQDGHGGEGDPRLGAVVQLRDEPAVAGSASLAELEEEAVRAGEGERLPVGDELSLLRLEDGVLQAVRDELAELGELRRGKYMGRKNFLLYSTLCGTCKFFPQSARKTLFLEIQGS